MSNNKNRIGFVQKCGGIPMYPAEYHFDIERPKNISDDDIRVRKERLKKFLENYNL